MNKKILSLLSLLFLVATQHFEIVGWDVYSLDKNLFVGNIIFPSNIKTIPQVPLYQRGTKVQTEMDNPGKKIQFTLSEDKKQRDFYFLITQHVQPKVKNNIVKYLKVHQNQAYKLFHLKRSGAKLWKIQEEELSEKRIIPDETLIIIFNPSYVDKVTEGNNFELPKILIKKDILALAGSEEKLHDEANELLMACLDLNILHIKPTSEIKSDYKKKLVIAMSTPE